MTIDELSTRLEQVERRYRRMRAAGTAVVVLAVAVAALGQAAPPPKVVRTGLVEIVDDKGVVRANLGMTPGGDESMHIRPALTIFSERGTTEQVTLGVTWTGMPLLNLANGPVPSALQLVGSGKQRGLFVRGKEASVHVGTESDDRPTITVIDNDGKVQFSAPR